MRLPAFVPLAIAAVLFIAGIVHIVSVLALPELAPKDAYSRVAALAQPGQEVLLPAAVPGQEVAPYSDPAMAQALCLFDLTRAPMRLKAKLDSAGFLSLSFRTRGGRVFYSMTDLAAVRGDVDIVVMTAAQREAAEAEDDDEDPPQELRLVSQTPTGFVLIQALAEHHLDRPAAEARLRAVSCAPDEDAEN